ncbi:MAG: hypothetical protein JXR73_18510 [Candidatus Omnitrophica bacterium]|nr:hypothetical protein [Candidatus Omnitrophota bacterium]
MPTVRLELADYIVMAVYMFGLIVLGLYYRRFAQKDIDNYFLAGRKLPGWLNGVSYSATCMNADVAPAYCGMTVICGLFICWWYISRFSLALMIGAVLFAAFWRQLKIFTSPEFYEFRFSGGLATTVRIWVALRSAFIAVVAWTGAGLLGLHKVSHSILGWEKWETFTVVIPVILLYVILSGYVGVVVSDLIQCLVMICASLLLMALVWNDFGGPMGLYTALVDQFGPSVVSWHPPASHELLGVVGVIAWTLGTAVGYGGDVAPMAGAMEGQRVLSCRNTREASKMYIWTEIVLFFMLAILTLPALGAMVKWPGLHDGQINKELAYGMLLGHYMPAGLLGLAMISLGASIMSTVDSNLNFGSQVFLNDIYRRCFAKNKSMRHYLNVGRIVTFVIISLAITVATVAENVIDISVFMLGLSSAELTANWGQWWWWRFNAKARIAASFGGPVLFLFNKFILIPCLFPDADSEYLVVFLSMGATLVLWVVTALCTQPDPDEVLIEFYKRARPFGWWGPIARKAGMESYGGSPILKGLGVALLGATAISSAIIAFSCLYVARWDVVKWAVLVSIITGLAFRYAYRGFCSFPDDKIEE